MSAPAKSVPAKVAPPSVSQPEAPAINSTGAPRKTRTASVPVDFSQVSIADGGSIKHERKSMLDGTPVRDWVKDSRANGNRVKTIQVSATSAKTLDSMLRYAASLEEVGISVGKPSAIDGKPGQVSITFATKDKKVIDMSPAAVAARKQKRDAAKAG